MPGPFGAHNWQPMSFSPETHLVYLPTQDVPFAYGDPKTFAPNPLAFNIGVDPAVAAMPDDAKAEAAVIASVHAYLKAWDPVAQKEVWRVEQPGPWNGGVLSTAGGLVFEGNAAGAFNAYAAAAAEGGRLSGRFSAGRGHRRPHLVRCRRAAIRRGGRRLGRGLPLSAGELAQRTATHRTTVECSHFASAARRRCRPFLPGSPPRSRRRRSATRRRSRSARRSIRDIARCATVIRPSEEASSRPQVVSGRGVARPVASGVIDGSRAKAGMVSFGPVLTPEFAERIRAFVVTRANATYAQTRTPSP